MIAELRFRRSLVLRRAALLTLALGALPAAATAERFAFDSADGSASVGLFGDVPALQSADVRFVEGEHHVQVIAFGPSWSLGASAWDRYRVALEDGTHGFFSTSPGGEDPIAGSAYWVDLREHGTIRQVYRTDCVGVCRVPMPRLAQGEIFVLLGFVLEFNDSDHRIQDIGVNTAAHGPYNGYIEVILEDALGTRPYKAYVQYAAVSMWQFTGHHQAYASTPAYSTATVPRSPGPAIVRGFRLTFLDGEHPLYRMSVSVATNNTVYVRLRDNSQDRPFRWWVLYSTLD